MTSDNIRWNNINQHTESIGDRRITSTGTTAIASSLLHSTSLEKLDMGSNAIGQGEVTAIAIIN